MIFLILAFNIVFLGGCAHANSESSIVSLVNLDRSSSPSTITFSSANSNKELESGIVLNFGDAVSVDYSICGQQTFETDTGLSISTVDNYFSGCNNPTSYLAIAVGGGLCHEESQLIDFYFDDYECYDDDEGCTLRYTWRTRQVFFIDLLSFGDDDDDNNEDYSYDYQKYADGGGGYGGHSAALGDCTISSSTTLNTTRRQYNRTEIEPSNVQPGELARIRVGDQIIEKQLSDKAGISFLILMEDPTTGEMILFETPKAGNKLHVSFAFVVTIIFGFILLLCCRGYFIFRYQERTEQQEGAAATNANDSRNENVAVVVSNKDNTEAHPQVSETHNDEMDSDNDNPISE